MLNNSIEAIIQNFEALPWTGCWIWMGRVLKDYGIADNGGHTEAAHRVVYNYYRHDLVPWKELHHTCHEPLCVNPDHLIQVTRVEHRRLENILVDGDDVYQIELAARRGLDHKIIAETYGVSRSTIWRIASGKYHVKAIIPIWTEHAHG